MTKATFDPPFEFEVYGIGVGAGQGGGGNLFRMVFLALSVGEGKLDLAILITMNWAHGTIFSKRSEFFKII